MSLSQCHIASGATPFVLCRFACQLHSRQARSGSGGIRRQNLPTFFLQGWWCAKIIKVTLDIGGVKETGGGKMNESQKVKCFRPRAISLVLRMITNEGMRAKTSLQHIRAQARQMCVCENLIKIQYVTVRDGKAYTVLSIQKKQAIGLCELTYKLFLKGIDENSVNSIYLPSGHFKPV